MQVEDSHSSDLQRVPPGPGSALAGAFEDVDGSLDSAYEDNFDCGEEAIQRRLLINRILTSPMLFSCSAGSPISLQESQTTSKSKEFKKNALETPEPSEGSGSDTEETTFEEKLDISRTDTEIYECSPVKQIIDEDDATESLSINCDSNSNCRLISGDSEYKERENSVQNGEETLSCSATQLLPVENFPCEITGLRSEVARVLQEIISRVAEECEFLHPETTEEFTSVGECVPGGLQCVLAWQRGRRPMSGRSVSTDSGISLSSAIGMLAVSSEDSTLLEPIGTGSGSTATSISSASISTASISVSCSSSTSSDYASSPSISTVSCGEDHAVSCDELRDSIEKQTRSRRRSLPPIEQTSFDIDDEPPLKISNRSRIQTLRTRCNVTQNESLTLRKNRNRLKGESNLRHKSIAKEVSVAEIFCENVEDASSSPSSNVCDDSLFNTAPSLGLTAEVMSSCSTSLQIDTGSPSADSLNSVAYSCEPPARSSSVDCHGSDVLQVLADFKDSDNYRGLGSSTSTICKDKRFPPTQVACRWHKCEFVGAKDNDLADHISEVHVNSQGQSGSFVCLWEQCKVFNVPSTLKHWLEQHVIKHSRSKPLKCIVDGCHQRFSTKSLLETHVNSHFEKQNKLKNGETPLKNLQLVRLAKRRKMMKNTKMQAGRKYDFFDACIMQQIKESLLQMAEADAGRTDPLNPSTPQKSTSLTGMSHQEIYGNTAINVNEEARPGEVTEEATSQPLQNLRKKSQRKLRSSSSCVTNSDDSASHPDSLQKNWSNLEQASVIRCIDANLCDNAASSLTTNNRTRQCRVSPNSGRDHLASNYSQAFVALTEPGGSSSSSNSSANRCTVRNTGLPQLSFQDSEQHFVEKGVFLDQMVRATRTTKYGKKQLLISYFPKADIGQESARE